MTSHVSPSCHQQNECGKWYRGLCYEHGNCYLNYNHGNFYHKKQFKGTHRNYIYSVRHGNFIAKNYYICRPYLI